MTEREINRKLTTTKRAIATLHSVPSSRDIVINTKKIIYIGITESIWLYRADTWTLSKTNGKKLLVTEMDLWRPSARISRLEKKTNTTVRNLLNVLQMLQRRLIKRDVDDMIT